MASDDRMECPKCRGAMEEGFELSQPYGRPMKPDDWVEGTPEPSLWTGTKLKGKARYRIASYRCERCGYLESYAR